MSQMVAGIMVAIVLVVFFLGAFGYSMLDRYLAHKELMAGKSEVVTSEKEQTVD